MKKAVLFLALILATTAANAGVLAGAVQDGKVAVRVATFPVRHPVVTERAIEKGFVAIGHSLKAAVKAAAKI